MVQVRSQGQSRWDLWWAVCQWVRFFSEYFGFPLSVSFRHCFYYSNIWSACGRQETSTHRINKTRSVRITLQWSVFTKALLWKSNEYTYLCVHVRPRGLVRRRECVCVGAVARACACARVALINQHAMHRSTVICGFSGSTTIFDIIS